MLEQHTHSRGSPSLPQREPLVDVVVARLLDGDEYSAELAMRLAVELGSTLTEIYEALRRGICGAIARTPDQAATRSELDRRLVRLAVRVPPAATHSRPPVAVVVSILDRAGSVCVSHMLNDAGVPAVAVTLASLLRNNLRLVGAEPQFAAAKFVVIDGGECSPSELSRNLRAVKRLSLLRQNLDVIVLVSEGCSLDATDANLFEKLSVVEDYFAVMVATCGSAGNPLTARERDVLRCVADGSTNERSAKALGISIGTVKTYMERVQVKLNSTDRASAVAVALRRGWL